MRELQPKKTILNLRTFDESNEQALSFHQTQHQHAQPNHNHQHHMAESAENGSKKAGNYNIEPNHILLFTLMNPLYPITVSVVHTICTPYANQIILSFL